MIRRAVIILCLFLLSSCSHHLRNYRTYEDDGCPKPRVVVLPVTINCEQLPGLWDASRELSMNLQESLMCGRAVYVYEKSKIKEYLGHFPVFDRCFLEGQLKGIRTSFCHADFVVLCEISDHSASHFDRGDLMFDHEGEGPLHSQFLKFQTRLLVIDVRCAPPVIVADEVFHTTYTVPCQEGCFDYTKTTWGTIEYTSSPLYHARERLAKDIGRRIESISWRYW